MELRKDYLLERWVIVSENRRERPKQFKEQSLKKIRSEWNKENPGNEDIPDNEEAEDAEESKEGEEASGNKEPTSEENNTFHNSVNDSVNDSDIRVVDYFAPGNEHMTPPELYRWQGNDGSWKIRVINNKFPAADMKGTPDIETHNEFYTFSSSFGDHEVIIETPDKNKQLWDFSTDELKELLFVYRDRINRAYESDKIRYVSLFKNHGASAGTSIIHSHSQLISMQIIPPIVKEKMEKSNLQGSSRYLEILEREKDSHRRCFENEHFAAFCPYASRFNYELLILPKKYVITLNEMSDEVIGSLALILKKTLYKLKELNCSFNLVLFNSRKEDGLIFHIEILPRISTWAGFEFSTGNVINSVNPEDAAAFYRGEHSQR